MRTFRLVPEGFQKIRRQVLTRGALLGVVAAPLVAVALYVLAAGGSVVFWWLALGVPLVTVVMGLQLYRRLKTQRQAWKAYQLDLGPDLVSRARLNKPDVVIRRDEVNRIEEVPGTGLLIRTADADKYIFVPDSLDGFAEAKGLLAQWRTIEPSPLRGDARLRPRSLALLAVVAMLAVAFSPNAAVIVVAAGLLVGYAAWIWLDMRAEAQADSRFRSVQWLLLLFTLLLVLRAVTVLRR